MPESSMLDENVIRYYDENAQEYNIAWTGKKDLALHYGFWESEIKHHSDALLNMNRVLSKRVGIKPTETVLDAGCGIGGSSIWIAKNIGAKVIGITITQKQVDTAMRLAREHGVEHLVKFYNMYYLHTKFKNNTFDVVWGLEALCHSRDKLDFIREAHRILKPKGRLIVADGFATKDVYDDEESRMMKRWLDGWAVPNLASIKLFENNLKSMHFRHIQFSDIKDNVMPSSRRIYKLAIAGISIYEILKVLRLRSQINVNHIWAGIYQHKTLKKGLWTYGIFYAQK